jgi:hypothetical protein
MNNSLVTANNTTNKTTIKPEFSGARSKEVKTDPESTNINIETQTQELHSAPEKNLPSINSKPPVDIGSEDLIKLFQEKILPDWQTKYKLSNASTGALKFTVKNFLDDHNMLRIVCALGNEVAVAINESMKQWGFPKPLANVLYYGLWAVAVVSCGARAVLRGLGTQNVKPFIESSIQDGIAAIVGPTGVVMLANKAQDAIYNAAKFVPQSIINFARPVISVVLAEMAIPRILDPIGKSVGKALTGLVPLETYSKWSESISKKLAGKSKISQAA